MPRKKDQHLHKKRQTQILQAAKRCFIERGFHQTTMREILETAGISTGAAYSYFSGKTEIVKALIDEESTDIDRLIDSLAASDNALKKIAQLVYNVIAYTEHNDAVLSIEIYVEACRNLEVKELTEINMSRLQTLINELILQGRKTGVISKTHTVSDQREWIMALLEGYISRIATHKQFNRKKAARMAKNSVLHVLGQK